MFSLQFCRGDGKVSKSFWKDWRSWNGNLQPMHRQSTHVYNDGYSARDPELDADTRSNIMDPRLRP